mmetsp:Transcript_34751/g.83093  ORF Transcript_34751/g.83093 Transcript_34751/m.83093 type:complete len:273 (-) Transcript_34751:106-924(-)
MTRCLFVRHGVALHNCPQADGRRANVSDPRYTDSPLVRGGQQQAIRLGDSMRRRGILPKISDGMDIDSADASGENFEIDLVVCSPLTRCIQTAKCLVPTFFEADSNRKTGGESGSTDESMYASDGTPCVLLEKECRLFCHHDLREAFGMHYSDKRGPLSRLKECFPRITFHPSITEDDTDWRPDRREDIDDVARRVNSFLQWLVMQPHENVLIVTHGVWMEVCFRLLCPEAIDFGRKRVYNCDVYTGILAESSDGKVVLQGVEQLTFEGQAP